MNAWQHRLCLLLQEEHDEKRKRMRRQCPLSLSIQLAESGPVTDSAGQCDSSRIKSCVVAEQETRLDCRVVVQGELAWKLKVEREVDLRDLGREILVHKAAKI